MIRYLIYTVMVDIPIKNKWYLEDVLKSGKLFREKHQLL